MIYPQFPLTKPYDLPMKSLRLSYDLTPNLIKLHQVGPHSAARRVTFFHRKAAFCFVGHFREFKGAHIVRFTQVNASSTPPYKFS